MIRVAVIAATLALAGCATTYQPRVEMPPGREAAYHDDLAVCRDRLHEIAWSHPHILPLYSPSQLADDDFMLVQQVGGAQAFLDRCMSRRGWKLS